MSQRLPLSSLTPKLSAPPSLGKYVVVKARAGGTARVYFQVPARLRPFGWSPAIPLPRSAGRTGDLTDLREVAAIIADARDLYSELGDVRSGAIASRPVRSLRALVDAWQASSAWPANPKTRLGYEFYITRIMAWERSQTSRVIDPTGLTRDDIEKFLALFNDRPATKKHVQVVLRMVMDQAIAKGWRADNPAARIKIKVPKSKAQVWEQTDVDAYVKAARAMGRDSIALIILLEWEIGQRLTDVRAFRPGAEYDAQAGVFRFAQSKTDSYVTIPVSATLRDLLAPAVKGELFMFRDEATKRAYDEGRLSKVFRQVAVAVGGRHLLLKWLRHSCVVQLARNGCTPLEIAAITGHAIASVVTILSVYLPRDNEVAWNAQVKRGLVERKTEVGGAQTPPSGAHLGGA
jgi:hypothetical protein